MFVDDTAQTWWAVDHCLSIQVTITHISQGEDMTEKSLIIERHFDKRAIGIDPMETLEAPQGLIDAKISKCVILPVLKARASVVYLKRTSRSLIWSLVLGFKCNSV